jgi:hypothetical protein
LLLQAFMPAWAAMQSAGQAGWTEICVSSGIKWVKLADAGESGSTSVHAGSEHCLFCAATGAAPEFDASAYLLPTSSYSLPVAVPSRFVAAVFPGHSLQSRAPPSRS